MPRGYRLLVIALGLVLFGAGSFETYQLYDASEQEHASYQYQPAAKPHVATLAVGQPPAKGYEPDCQNPNSPTNADLCAQWAAVEQVAESNRLSSLNVRLAVFVALLTAIGTGLVVWTFKETRDTSRRELRAYLFPEGVGCYETTETAKNKIGRTITRKTGFVGAGVAVKNSGQTPAYKVSHDSQVCVCKVSEEHLLKINPKTIPGYENPMPPGGFIHKTLRMQAPPTAEQIEGLKSGTYAVYVYGRLEYEDAFERLRFTEYKFLWGGWPIPENIMMNFAQTGNDAN